MNTALNDIPLHLAGPLIRQCVPTSVAFWFVTSRVCDVQLHTAVERGGDLISVPLEGLSQRIWPVGKHCFIYWLVWTPKDPLPENVPIYYDLVFSIDDNQESLADSLQDIRYDGQDYPSFTVNLSITEIVHGSCRKPHHKSADALVQLDKDMSRRLSAHRERPNFLMMTGDQVYVDDVAGPMLLAIHQVIARLGLFDEVLPEAEVRHSSELFSHPDGFYQRHKLLPDDEANDALSSYFWRGKRKPIFTSVNSNNHLIAFNEMMAMYLLVWSPALWPLVDLDDIHLPTSKLARYHQEKLHIQQFVSGLAPVRRLLAHLPSYMIFDDHDITDDWNLNRQWEEASYTNQFSRRIIGNALIAYLLCQGWGNDPSKFDPLLSDLSDCFDGHKEIDPDPLISHLFEWHNWHYSIKSDPPTFILDTRTRRWRSESSPSKPSGLMDWESLCDLQQQLLGKDAVIMVSAAPVFGVKLIEAMQKIFTFFGQALMVDAENWMAHKGAASVMLNIFRHKRTPPLFIILSGDVHYSFVYDVSLKFSTQSPRILQVTASGFKNEFPRRLLLFLDTVNRLLFHKRSPLNWLTRRRYMSIQTRKPAYGTAGSLLNASAVGVLKLTDDKKNIQASMLTADGDVIEFRRSTDHA